MSKKTQFIAALTVLFALRFIAGWLLPLSADEAYYWLWSRHLAAGYFDHPPAIAFVIAAGTALFGDTAFGVRFAGILLSIAASWFVWRTAVILIRDETAAATACLLFNLTLMITVETLAATPDAPQIFFAAVFIWCLAKVAETGDGHWWLLAGLAAGLGLLSKYSTLFVGMGALVWLIGCPRMRRWFRSPWPYFGGALAFLVFLPNLNWNAAHGWTTFVFQFGRIEGSHLTLKYLGEFVGAQFLLATPFVLILGMFGLGAARFDDKRRALIAAILWPSIAYFLFHSLHDRVQGNWPCYLYPILSVAAADAMARTDWRGWKKPAVIWSARLAMPLAGLLLFAGYAQALAGVVPFGRKDPLARLLAVGLPEVVDQVGALERAAGADVLLTTDYATTGWFAFYGRFSIANIGEDYRWPNAPQTAKAQLQRPALYIAEMRLDRHDLIARRFAKVTAIARLDRLRKGVPIAHYVVYLAEGPKGADFGRMP